MDVKRARTVRIPFGYNLRAAIPPRGIDPWLDEVHPDVLHVHHPFPICATAAHAARRRGIPVVATNHTIPSCSLYGIRHMGPIYSAAHAALGWWIVRLLSQCEAVATPTDTAARHLRALGFSGDVRVISNGIDTVRFSPGRDDSGLGARLGLDDRPVILYTGRLDAEKEMDVWLRAAAAVSRREDVQFVVGGEGAGRKTLERLAADLGLTHLIRFIGYVAETDLPNLYRLADVYMITSPVELQSITTLEAVASGLPVVGVRAGALPELVRENENGYCVGQGRWQEAATALENLLGNEQLRHAMGGRSRELALTHSLERSVQSYEELLAGAAVKGEEQIERTAGARG